MLDSKCVCLKLCKQTNKAIACDECSKWYHAKCINMLTDQYNTLNSCLKMNTRAV